ncbi:hypothetical protein KDK_00920 [Dictyobacter kobayashii]|uniref:histidine kinase n=2 Tax=Dictyobacter kobayashii TaxID=2014872 RepID=A0A402AAT9_9CHLR|nr:ATP-binding protein [Dictyobacter kobayashii]GCE16292.1 hypothetical protein KDK_00920 [Dictyobacter kobayashii]
MVYLIDQEKQVATLAGTSGIKTDHPVAPETVALTEHSFWPFNEVIKARQTQLVTRLDRPFHDLPTGAWHKAPYKAALLPMISSGQTGQTSILIVGLNPFRAFDEEYQRFLSLVAGQITASITNVQAYEEERKRAEALAEIDRAKTLFFSNISHEFRTPLTLMLGPIEELLSTRQHLLPEQYENTTILHQNALRLLKLVNTLLDFSRIEAGRMQAVYTPTDLATMTIDLVSNFRSAIEKAGVQLVVNCPPLSSPVYVDQGMWEKIVMNLLSNAFKYTLHGCITVTLQPQGTNVVFSVQDTGVGIPESELPHMFERFHRVTGVEGRTYEGTGIGLSLVYELVKLHEGTIEVTSTLGVGSTFTISLPFHTHQATRASHANVQKATSSPLSTTLYKNELTSLIPGYEQHFEYISEEQESIPTSSPAISEVQPGAKGEIISSRILFVDDNADMRAYVSRLLRATHDVLTVPNGKAALEVVKQYHPDLVLTDIMMPGMNGFELLEALRSMKETRNTPVILLSARAGEEAQVEGIQAGADDYLIKPFSAQELLARVNTHLKLARMRKETEVAIQTEQEQLYDLFWQAPAAIAVVEGQDHTFALANPSYQNLFDRTQEELVGKSFRRVFPEVSGQGIYEIFDNVFESGETFTADEFPVIFNKADNEQRYFNFVVHPIKETRKTQARMLILVTEVTEQVLTRQYIKESEARFRTLADNIPNLVWMATPDGWRYWYNSRWYDYTGKTFEELKGWGWQDTHHPRQVEQIVNKMNRSLQTGEPWEDTFTLRKYDGTYSWFLARAIPIRNEQGEIIHWFGTNTDITALKEAEEETQKLTAILEATTDFVATATLEGKLQYINQAGKNLVGESEAPLESIYTAYHPLWAAQIVQEKGIPTALQHGIWTGETALCHKNGVEIPVSQVILAHKNDQGTVSYLSTIARDITEQKQLQQKKDDFIGIVSHELKTPVTSVKAYAQLLERQFRKAGDTRSSSLLVKMDAQLTKLTTLIGDLLDVTKLESGQLQLHPSSFDYNTLVKEIIEEIQRTTTKVLQLELAESVVLCADRDRIGQVLTNLLTNAIKYSPKAEKVLVRTEIKGACISTSVQDFGIGIPQEKLQHIFQRFFRVEGDTQSTYPGLGLGLYISAEFVKRHHGSIYVESESGKGSIFTFSLPLDQQDVTA